MANQETPLFWADQAAKEISTAHSRYVVGTGITPSGEIHIGNMREIVTADAVVRSLKSLGKEAKLIYIADTFDPLRRVYPFLDPKKYTDHVGKPLSEIPCPCGQHLSYAEHYLAPFLRALNVLDISVEVARADQLYKNGRYTPNIVASLKNKERIRKILQEETGKEATKEWSPFNPICQTCGRMTNTVVLGFDEENETVHYRCGCGNEGNVPIAGGGKLTWRVDWPARWDILGITVEPFGKDHASRGGSYDTGVRLAREIFSHEPPFPLVYEWISLRGEGDMSSSKGNVLSVHEMIEVVPPQVLKYSVLKVKPNRSIVFDPGLPLVSLMDEIDDESCKSRNPRAVEISMVSGEPPLGVPFRHLVSLIQITQGNVEEIEKILRRTGYSISRKDVLQQRVLYAQKWLEKFGPEEIKFSLQKEIPPQAQGLTEKQRRALGSIAQQFKEGFKPEEIHSLIYSVKEKEGLSTEELFEAIYLSLLGKTKGPRAGFFLASLDFSFLKKRFEEVSSNPGVSS